MPKPFIPYKLPLNNDLIDLNFFINDLIEANSNLAVYKTLLNECKIDKKLLIAPITLQEAIQSTRIEGTQVTLDDVLEYNVDDKKINSEVEEVINYSRALLKGGYLLNTLPISTRLFKELHFILLSGDVRGNHRTPGEFRTVQNFIGPPNCDISNASFVPPEPQLISDYMSNLEIYINESNDNLNHLIRIAIIHAQFETIHPFLDGNGRIGRILIPLYLYNKNLIESPNFFLSETLEKDKFKYYKLLNDTRYKGNWNEWIKFFLEAVSNQSKKNINLIKSINQLYDKDLQKCKSLINSNRIINILNIIFEHPIFNISMLNNKTGIPVSTLSKYTKILEENNIIFSDGKSRNKKFYYYNLINLLR